MCYQVPKGTQAKKMLPYDSLKQVEINYKSKYDLDPDITYEGDLKITTKHAMDYYHFSIFHTGYCAGLLCRLRSSRLSSQIIILL